MQAAQEERAHKPKKLKKASKQQAAHAAEALFQAPSGFEAFATKLLQVRAAWRRLDCCQVLCATGAAAQSVHDVFALSPSGPTPASCSAAKTQQLVIFCLAPFCMLCIVHREGRGAHVLAFSLSGVGMPQSVAAVLSPEWHRVADSHSGV